MAEDDTQSMQVGRLSEIVVGAALDGGDGVVDGAVGRHHHDGHAGMGRAQLRQQFDAVVSAETQIEQQQFRRLVFQRGEEVSFVGHAV